MAVKSDIKKAFSTTSNTRNPEIKRNKNYQKSKRPTQKVDLRNDVPRNDPIKKLRW